MRYLGALGTRVFERFQSLPTRITFFVFAVTLLTSLAVTAFSMQSISAFLREGMDQRFPASLDATAQRIDLWYDQRVLEIDVFSSSVILVENVPALAKRSASSRRARGQREVEQYLSYVLDGFPQYDGLLLLDTTGEILLSVGRPLELPDALRVQVAKATSGRVSDIVLGGHARLWITS